MGSLRHNDADALSVDDARAIVVRECRRLEAERVSLSDALGRVLASDVVSTSDVAPFDNSAMDGYALRAIDVADASEDAPQELNIIARIGAGDICSAEVGPGQAARIMTGAPMPPGADAVVKQEDTVCSEGTEGEAVRVLSAVPQGRNVRFRGEEARAGDIVMREGDLVGAAGVGLLAATGNGTVEVYRRPTVAIVVTGSELADVSDELRGGAIRDSNGYSLAAQVMQAGGLAVRLPLVGDDPDAVSLAFKEAASSADVIVSSGGACGGDHDHVRDVLRDLGAAFYTRIRMRPGAAQLFGSVRGVPFFGLPGNPSATFVGFEVLIRPALRLMQGFRALERPRCVARLMHDVDKPARQRVFLRGVMELDGHGEAVVRIAGPQSSALLGAAHACNCLIVRPEGSGPLSEGECVEIMRLDMEAGSLCAPSPIRTSEQGAVQ